MDALPDGRDLVGSLASAYLRLFSRVPAGARGISVPE
jgi:hypothetical protein